MNRFGVTRKIAFVIMLAILVVIVLATLIRTETSESVNQSNAEADLSTANGPTFEVKLTKPLSARPLGGLFGLLPAEDLGFDHLSSKAEIVSVSNERIEFKATDWQLVIEIDDDGNVAPSSFLFVSMELGGRVKDLICRPSDPVVGQIETHRVQGTAALSGQFRFELPSCERAETGKATNWPPEPLTVRGKFSRLPITSNDSVSD